MVVKINSRLIDVFKYINESNGVSIKEICSKLGLTERSVRYEIENINYILRNNGIEEIEKLQKGNLLFKPNKKAEKLFGNLAEFEIVSKDERIEYVALKLLVKGTINISQICRELDVSRSTIKNDLKDIELDLNLASIKMINNTISAPEKVIRNYILKNYNMILCELYCENLRKSDKNSIIQDFIYKNISQDDLKLIKAFTNDIASIFKNNDNKLYNIIFPYLIISYLRIVNGNEIQDIQNRSFLKSTAEYKYLADIIRLLENSLSISISELELLMLVDYVLGCLSYTYNTSIFEYWIEIGILVKEIIEYVDDNVPVNIKNDNILLEGLLNHIKPTIYRVKNDLSIEKELYYESIEGYPELYGIVKKSLAKLEMLIDREFHEGEIALYTIHFLAAIRRNQENLKEQKRILLVCGGGYGTSVLIKDLIEENYNVDIVDNISYFQLLDYNLENIDVVVSTIRLSEDIKNKLKKPVVLVTPFFTFKDDKILEKYGIVKKVVNKLILNDILEAVRKNASIINEDKLISELYSLLYKKNNYEFKTSETLFDNIDESKVEILDRVDSWQDALNICGRKLIITKEIKEEYLKEIFNVIETFGAYFVIQNQIAIPHGQLKINVNSPCMSVLYVKEGVVFPGDRKAKLIILLASSQKNILIKTVEKINKLSSNKSLYEDIKNITSKEKLLDYLKMITA